jgi:hypothetical protein
MRSSNEACLGVVGDFDLPAISDTNSNSLTYIYVEIYSWHSPQTETGLQKCLSPSATLRNS